MTEISAGDLKLMREQLEKHPIQSTLYIDDVFYDTGQCLLDVIANDCTKLQRARQSRNIIAVSGFGGAATEYINGMTEYYLTVDDHEYGVSHGTFDKAIEMSTELPDANDFEWSEG